MLTLTIDGKTIEIVDPSEQERFLALVFAGFVKWIFDKPDGPKLPLSYADILKDGVRRYEEYRDTCLPF